MKGILQFLELIGGLGVFLVGMRIMSDGVHKRSGTQLQKVLHTMTNNRFAGVLTGLGVTAIIQSSSATTVLLVSLVNAGLITLKQSIGVVMGANIGTTLTAWIVSLIGFKFHISSIALPAIAVGLPLYFSKVPKRRETADILIGFGLLFLGLGFMKESVPDIKNNPEVLSFLQHWASFGYGSILLFVAIGTLLTIVVQSSSAAMAITITMAYNGWIDFQVAAAVVLGENIGTTITAYLASMQLNATAKRTARAHMVFNLIGVLWMLILFIPFTNLMYKIIPADPSDPTTLPVHLSLFHTMFNITNTLLLIGFIDPISRLVEKMVKDDSKPAGREPYRLKLVPENFAEAVDSNLITIRRELGLMAKEAGDMLTTVLDAAGKPDKIEEIHEELSEREQRIDDMQEQIIEYLTECMSFSLGLSQSRIVTSEQRIANELESVADSVYGISLLMRKLYNKGWHIHKKGDQELLDFSVQVLDFIKYNEDYLFGRIEEYDLEKAREMENGIDKMRSKLRKVSRKKIEKSSKVDVKGELIFLDIIRHMEHIGDSCLNISEAIAEAENF